MKRRSTRTESHTKQQPINKTQSQTFTAREPSVQKRSRSLYNKLANFLDEVVPPPPPAEPRNTVAKSRQTVKDYIQNLSSVTDEELQTTLSLITKMADEKAPSPENPPLPPPGDEAKHNAGRPSASSFTAVDSSILQELREADAKANKTSKLIESMKKDIIKFSQKTNMNEDDLKKLGQMHEALNRKLSEFEEIATNVQRLLGIADLDPEKLALAIASAPGGDDESRYTQEAGTLQPGVKVDETCHLTKSEEEKMAQLEDKLPKIIICGTGQEEVPKIIVCERIETVVEEEENLARGLAEKLCDSYKMQEKLATEAAEMEGSRYSLQEEIMTKDRRVDTLQKQVACLQTEMKLIAKENAQLQKKLLQSCQPPHPPMCKRELYKKFTGSLPDFESTGATNNDIEKAVDHMEGVLGCMKSEISDLQAERKSLKGHTQMLQCCAPYQQPTCKKELAKQQMQTPPNPCVKELENQLKDLTERYNRLNCDFNGKIGEIACLRTELKNERIELEGAAERVCYAEARADDLLDRLKMVEVEKQAIIVNREQFIDMEQQLCMAKQRIQNCQEESESLQVLVQEQASQIEDYKEKYMCAQQTVEEQKRVVERLHVQSLEAKENLLLEMQQFMTQIGEKLVELEPLPEKVKLYETKLELSQQNIDDLTKELMESKEGLGNGEGNLSTLRADKAALEKLVATKDCELDELKNQVTGLRATLERFETLTTQNEWKFEEKVSEVTQLTVQLTTVREESARQIIKTKERCEMVRKLMTAQISMLEKQLAESRACANAAAKERDEIRVRMQQQVTNLSDNFGQAQLRIKTLQDHINYLKTAA